MKLLPDRGVGVAVFTNRNQSMVPEILANYVFDPELPEAPRSPAARPARHLIFHRHIASLAAPFEPLVKDVVFACIPAGDCKNPAFRQHCTGTFS